MKTTTTTTTKGKRHKAPEVHPWKGKWAPSSKQLGLADYDGHVCDHINHCRKNKNNTKRLP